MAQIQYDDGSDDYLLDLPRVGLTVEALLYILDSPHRNVLYKRSLNDETAQQVAQAVRANNSVTRFGLIGCAASSHQISMIIAAFATSVVIQELDLSKNHLGEEGATALAALLIETTCLKSLVLNSMQQLSYKEFSMLTDPLGRCRSLSQLRLDGIEIDEEIAHAIGQVLAGSLSLRGFSLRQTRFPRNTFRTVCDGAKVAEQLSALWLDVNVFESADTASVLADLISGSKSLTSLDVKKTGMDDDDVADIARALASTTVLRYLNISSNPISSKGLRHLLASLHQNRSLIELSIIPVLPNYRRSRASGLRPLLSDVAHLIDRNRHAYASAVTKALDNRATAPLNRSKVMLLGAGASGKTATVRSLLSKPFEPEWRSTIGIDTTQTSAAANGLWQEESTGSNVDHTSTLLAQMVHENFQHAAVDLDKDEGENRPTSQKKPQSQSTHPRQHHTRTTLASTGKAQVSDDSSGKEVSVTSLRRLEGENGRPGGLDAAKMKLLEVSSRQDRFKKPYKARTQARSVEEKASAVWGKIGAAEVGSIKLSIFDYGGQHVFHTLHTLFLSAHGVYLLVFNTRRFIAEPDETCKTIAYWLSSTSVYAPEAAVLLVGTFIDDLTRDEVLAVASKLQQLVTDGEYKGVVTSEEGNELLFAVDNKSGVGVDNLRKAVQKCAEGQESVHVQVRLRWMQLLDWLLEEERPWVGTEEVRGEFEKLKTEEDSEAGDEVSAMLALFHQVGLLSYFTSTETLANIVVVHTQWLVDAVSKVVRDKDIHPVPSEVRAAKLTEDYAKLQAVGIASKDLLECLWKDSEAEFLLDLMHSLFLLSRWSFDDQRAAYLIPSMVRGSGNRFAMEDADIVLQFTFLPPGVFERLVCLSIEYATMHIAKDSDTEGQPKLYKDLCSTELRKGLEVTLQKANNCILVSCEPATRQEEMCFIVLSMLRKIKGTIPGNAFRWSVKRWRDEELVEFHPRKSLPGTSDIDIDGFFKDF